MLAKWYAVRNNLSTQSPSLLVSESESVSEKASLDFATKGKFGLGHGLGLGLDNPPFDK